MDSCLQHLRNVGLTLIGTGGKIFLSFSLWLEATKTSKLLGFVFFS